MSTPDISGQAPDPRWPGTGARRRGPVLAVTRSRIAILALVLMLAVLAVAGRQLAAGASPTPDPVACPRLAGTLPTVTIPRCPPPCPTTTVTPRPTVDPLGGSVAIARCPCPDPDDTPIIRTCPPPALPTTAPSTTAPPTIPIDGFAIAGTTENRLCTGPPTLCRNPFVAASDDVIIRQNGQVVAQATSDAQGRFRIPVGPGTYEAQAAPRLGVGLAALCPAQPVVVSGPPVPKVITLQCTIVGP